MKKISRLFVLIYVFAFLSACSYKPSLELINTNATIANDIDISGSIGITEGEKKGQELVPTVLYYEFSIKNTGSTKIGGSGDNGISVKIEPHDKLKSTVEDIIGFNIFNPDEYENSGLGYGQSYDGTMLKSGDEGNFSLTFDLGVSEENPNTNLITPSEELLEEINKHALDASLLVISAGEVIAKFDLSTLE